MTIYEEDASNQDNGTALTPNSMIEDEGYHENLNDTPFTLLECDQHQNDIRPCLKFNNKQLGDI